MDLTEKNINEEAYDLRVNKGQLPTIMIAGHTFFVDIRMDMLRPKDDFLSKGIVFSDIQNYYDEDQNSYIIPYNRRTHEFQDIDFSMINEFPKDLIAVQFPIENELDRIGWNRHHGFELTEGLSKQGFKMQFEAKQISWEDTVLADMIKSNLKYVKVLGDCIEKPNKNKSKGRKI
ncbi:hypothetical protein SAMN06265171_105196 [Chryseobacterium rhizoplanae]|uniref:Uncharacterized protein n=1 Tax=Chryseobacterium rhizoplanae TaxID=1609531 RepID=A0A521DJZ1_9FLAO|nr:hypothetical protein [Chryseobacterium rhizoplanae]SMO72053.1 hypothetical protein SAMN06265171_105196 [Chryseobacterium rhizoplanae]